MSDPIKRCRQNEEPWCEDVDRDFNVEKRMTRSEIRVESPTGCKYEGKRGITGNTRRIQGKKCSPAEIDTIESEIEEMEADPKVRDAGKKVYRTVDTIEKAKTGIGAAGVVAGTAAGEPIITEKSLNLLI